jgi:hypothetical protein
MSVAFAIFGHLELASVELENNLMRRTRVKLTTTTRPEATTALDEHGAIYFELEGIAHAELAESGLHFDHLCLVENPFLDEDCPLRFTRCGLGRVEPNNRLFNKHRCRHHMGSEELCKSHNPDRFPALHMDAQHFVLLVRF